MALITKNTLHYGGTSGCCRHAMHWLDAEARAAVVSVKLLL